MEIKKPIITRLEEEYIQTLTRILEKNKLTKRDIFAEALKGFESKIPRNGTYEVKFANFDRLYTEVFQISIRNESVERFYQLSEKLNITRSQLLREILLTYLIMNKSK